MKRFLAGPKAAALIATMSACSPDPQATEPEAPKLELGELVGDYENFFTGEPVPLQEGQIIELAASAHLVLVRTQATEVSE